MIRFVHPKVLRAKGILGMNARNASYIAQYNDRSLYPVVDDKLRTKKLMQQHGLPTPELYETVRYQHELKQLEQRLEPHDSFVIKPACGSEGKGILIITARDGDEFIRPGGGRLKLSDLKRHIGNILNGLYSLGGRPDKAFIECAINFSTIFEGFSYQGIPDVRVVVFKGYPIMAMTRLSTKVSDGKANLHQGAVGVGLNLKTGRAQRAVQFNQPLEKHPDTGIELSDLAVPRWDELLLLAARAFDVTGLGYLGVDIVLDRELGPMVLELNARPGLSIQMANDAGQLPRLQRIEEISGPRRFVSPEERIAFALEHFP